jgi:putative ABC transport system permease protein
MLEMMKIKMAQGRYLDPKITSDTINSMMVNEIHIKDDERKIHLGSSRLGY